MSLHANARKAKRATGSMGLQVLWIEPFGSHGSWVVSGWGTGADKRELARDPSLRRALRDTAKKAANLDFEETTA